VVPEATFVQTKHGLVPEGEGWFVVNARETRWGSRDGVFGSSARFEGDNGAEFPEIGINIRVLEPGRPNGHYHGEVHQEAFLVLSGECLLLVEGEERPLRPWDFVHLPPWTEHILVGAGDGPCVVVMMGGRFEPDRLWYPRSEVALRHGAGVERDTDSPDESYAGLPEPAPRRYREGDLP
jgi:uncharacterized cupin superfamily protein